MRRALCAALAAVAACAGAAGELPTREAPRARATASDAGAIAHVDASSAIDASTIPEASIDASDAAAFDMNDAMAMQVDTKDELLALFPKLPDALAANVAFLPGGMNQGNKAVAHHEVAKRACMDGLKDVVIQTDEQRARCGGAPNMVPVFAHGDPSTTTFCVDVFEYPNKPCELPIVWTSPAAAEQVCEAEGKRLCDQEEWNLACRGDPTGGADQLYAYGNELDVTVCNTNKSRVDKPRCDISSMTSIWETCTTDTEPSGAFPKCRSRFGVFDQHGNVAEIMTRFGWNEPLYTQQTTYSQLKGSAWFYVDVQKKPFDGVGYYERYPDHCNFDPRWHVEPIKEAAHVNYHLGFRCCKDVGAPRDAGTDGD